MKKDFFAPVLLLVCSSLASAQTQPQPKNPPSSSESRPRVVSPAPSPSIPSVKVETDSEINEVNAPKGTIVGSKPESRPPVAGPTATERHAEPLAAASRVLSPPQIQSRIVEAERLLKSRPLQTASTSPATDIVTLAALDRATARIHLVTLYKDSFLTKGSELSAPSSFGVNLNIRILRANGVNTAVAIFDNQGRSLVPLVVEFPIEKRGVFREMAYYTSAHPALLSPDLSRSGRAYVHRMIDLAVKRLRDKGTFISPQIVAVAGRLVLVEHVDHDRFRLENRLALFDEIYSLFALNEPDTYRYSVSSAGAGGMVQMIPGLTT